MGCAASKLEDEEAVKMCRDRRDFIKQALEQRNRFASSHIAYIESLKRVSMALQRFVAGDDHHELIFDTFISPVKQQKPEVLGLPYGSYEKRTIHVSRYLRSGPNPSVSVEEHPQPVETVRVESHYPMDNDNGMDRFLPTHFDTFISPVKQQKPEVLGLPYGSYEKRTIHVSRYLRSGPNPSVSVEEHPQPVETVRVESHYPMDNDNGMDRFLPTHSQVRSSSYYPPPYNRPSYPSPLVQEPVRNSSSYYMPYDRSSYAPPSPQEAMRASYYGFYDRPSYPSPSPQEPQRNSYHVPHDRPIYPPLSPQEQESSPWDSFWNPFSSLDSFTYPRHQSSYDNVVTDDELARLQRVREEEGIPELEEEDDECQDTVQMHRKEEKEGHDNADDDEDEDDEEDDEDECEHSDECMVSNEDTCSVNFDAKKKQETKGIESKGIQCTEAPEPPKTVELEIMAQKKELMRNRVANTEGTPGFTVYLNRRPASLVEAMKDIECQFSEICDAAREISVMLEASRAQYSSSNDLSAKMLNPVALLRSASSRSSSSRFLLAPSSSIDDLYDNETSSCYSEESCSTMSGSHHSTLDRLYTWEKKLYKEVKAGERLRIEYEKRLTHLRNQDVKGEEPSSVDKTCAALRSLHTRLKVSIHTVQSISRRIEILRDEELHPQLMELIQGLSRMWRAMAERHKAQKRTIEDAKLLFLQHHPSAATAISLGPPEAATPPPAALALESEIQAWRGALETWLFAQRAYARALAAWARRCLGISSAARPTHSLPPAFLVCMEWGRAVDAATEARVIDGLDFFVAGVESVCKGMATGMEGMAGRVLCAGMAAVTGAMAEFAGASADSYDAAVTAVITAARAPERGKENCIGQLER